MTRRVRRLAAQGRHALAPHAEIRKGIREIQDSELLAVLTRGNVVEVYPKRRRMKVRGAFRGGERLNVVVEFDAAGEILSIVSTFFGER